MNTYRVLGCNGTDVVLYEGSCEATAKAVYNAMLKDMYSVLPAGTSRYVLYMYQECQPVFQTIRAHSGDGVPDYIK